MLLWFFTCSVVVLLVAVLLRKRYIDFWTFFALSNVYYSSPLFIGKIYNHNTSTYESLLPHLYVFYAFLFIVMSVSIVIYDKYIANNISVSVSSREKFFLLFVLISISTIIVLDDPSLFFPRDVRAVTATKYGFIYSIYVVATLAFVGLTTAENSKLKYVSYLFLLLLLLEGSRAYFLAGCLIIAVLYARRYGRTRILTNIPIVVMLISGFVFMVIYKVAYTSILELDFASALRDVTDVGKVAYRMTNGAESIVTLNFNNAIILSEQQSGSFEALVLTKLVPFVSEELQTVVGLPTESFSEILKSEFYPNVGFGLASSLWGVLYYTSGGIGLAIFCIVFLVAFLKLQATMLRLSSLQFFLLPAMSLVSFYASRWEPGNVVYFFYVGGVLYLGYLLWTSLLRFAG